MIGLKVHVSHDLPPVEDWSDVRSPGRARRRLKRGFKQRIKYSENMSVTMVGNIAIMGPRAYALFQRRMDEEAKRISNGMDNAILRASLGGY